MAERIRERTLYEHIGRVFEKHGCTHVTQVGVGQKEPDLLIELDGSSVVSEVKIDSDIKREDAIVDAYAKAMMLGTPHSMALLFPRLRARSNFREQKCLLISLQIRGD